MPEKLILAIDVGATWTRFGIFKKGTLLRKVKTKTREFFVDPKAHLKGFEEISGSLEGVGIGSIGPLDIRKGILLNPPNVDVREFPLKEIIEEALGATPFIVNDCSAAVWGEAILGKGKDLKDLVYVTISTGIGAGVVIGRRLLVGRRGNAHEAGHGVIDYRSTLRCNCGGRGHWEALASGKNIPRFVKERTGKNITEAKELFDSYRRGEEWSISLIDELSRIYAAGLATIIAYYDPETIFIGGSVFLGNEDILLGKIRNYLKDYSPYEELPSVFPATFKEDAVLYGAAALILQEPELL